MNKAADMPTPEQPVPEQPVPERPTLPGTPRLIPPPPGTRRGRRLVRMAIWGGGRLDRVNRLVFTLLGLVVAAAGAAGLLLYEHTITTTSPQTIYDRWVRDARGAVDASAAIATGICLVVFLLGVWWALAQLRPVGDGERVGTIRLARGPRGKTNLAAATLARAASADLGSRPGVTSAKVRLRSVLPHPRIQVTVEVGLDVDIEATIAQVEDAMDQLVGALDETRADTDVEIRVRFARSARHHANRPGRVD